MQNASWILDGTDPALHIPDSFFELQNPFESRSLQIDGIDQNYLPDREEASKFSPPASQKGDGRRAKRQTSRLIGALRQSPGSPCALQLTTGSVVYGLEIKFTKRGLLFILMVVTFILCPPGVTIFLSIARSIRFQSHDESLAYLVHGLARAPYDAFRPSSSNKEGAYTKNVNHNYVTRAIHAWTAVFKAIVKLRNADELQCETKSGNKSADIKIIQIAQVRIY
uniref:G_PROTEIN_RECEP_F1_2 domain-containing protein n=1 Tax=Heterorhabditis bacteriophora TaxID=37862 RepID=A0A1I7WQP9_HETBA